MLRTQSQGRSNNFDPCGAKGGQRPPPCPPPQPLKIVPGAPHAALRPGERGWAHPQQPEQCQTEHKGPQNHRPCEVQAVILEPNRGRADKAA